MKTKTNNDVLESATAEGVELIEAIQRADKAGVYIPELAERAFGVAMVLEALVTSGDETEEPRLE